ncbi:MAG: biotin/lipoyl-binding protein [Epsilonproteobacteria bacterium]|nr:biotin/lipoyl-binding protein [Campylobacterota bacterium]
MPLTHEKNFKRKAHRVQVPLTVVIDRKSYTTSDWSMTGVGIKGLDRSFSPDEEIDASLVLPLAEAKIEIPVTLAYKSDRGGEEKVKGFAFAKISERNRKVLKEFLEQAIEGRLDQTDTLLDICNEPVIDTPLKEPVVLADEEHESLKKTFQRRSLLFLAGALVLFLGIGVTVFYNTRYLHETVGTVTGNALRIKPAMAGTVREILVKEGQDVTRGTLLFLLDDRPIREKIAALQARLKEIEEALQEKASVPPAVSAAPARPAVSPTLLKLIEELEAKYRRQQKALSDAERLFKNHLIDRKSYLAVKNGCEKTKIELLKAKSRLPDRTITPSGPIQKPSNPTRMLGTITNLKLRIAEAKQELEKTRIYSPTDGKIFTVKAKRGERVGPSRPVLAIETENEPFVLCQIPSQIVAELHPGIEAEFFSPSRRKKFSGHIVSIGELAVDPGSSENSEIVYNLVPIKIVPDAPVRLPLNERVKVWIHRPLTPLLEF